MNHSNFIILLARQRSGTNALRSVLEPHPDIFCFNEVFNLRDVDSEDDLLRESNFFNFQKKYAQGDISRVFPNKHENLFLDFLEYLRCFTSKRYILIDVKYNTTHFLMEENKWNLAPYLFYLIKTYGLRVFNLTRKNYLRFVVSELKAERSGLWTLSTSATGYKDEKIRIDIDYLLRQLNYCGEENQLIDNYFSLYPEYFSYDYEDVFSEGFGRVSDDFLYIFSERFGIDNRFKNETEYKKQSYLPLEETIENYEEVAKALCGTKFEYCLEDEKMYSNFSMTH